MIGPAVAATTLACAFVLVVRRMQVPFDTSGIGLFAAVVGGILLVAVVDVSSTGVGPGSRTLQRLAVRLGLALVLAALIPGPSALVTPPHPLRLVATAAAVAAAVIALVVPLTPSVAWAPAMSPASPPTGARRGHDRQGPSPLPGRRRRKADHRPMPSPPPVEVRDGPPQAGPSPADAVAAPPVVAEPAVPGILQQRFERYVLTDERVECLRGTLHLAVVAGSRLVTGHVGFCPPFHHLPQVEVGTRCEEVEATIVAAEVLPWGVRIECRLDEPADETIRIAIDVIARAPLAPVDASHSPPSPLR